MNQYMTPELYSVMPEIVEDILDPLDGRPHPSARAGGLTRSQFQGYRQFRQFKRKNWSPAADE